MLDRTTCSWSSNTKRFFGPVGREGLGLEHLDGAHLEEPPEHLVHGQERRGHAWSSVCDIGIHSPFDTICVGIGERNGSA